MLATHSAASALESQICRAKMKSHRVCSVCGKRKPDGRSQKGNSPSLFASLLFTALALGRAVCCAVRAEPSTHLSGAPSRRPSIPAQEQVREVSACPSLTVFSPPASSYNSSFLPFRKSTESTTPTRNIIHSIMVQLITISIKWIVSAIFRGKGEKEVLWSRFHHACESPDS